MKKALIAVAALLLFFSCLTPPAIAEGEGPVIYEIKKGDTLWGLSEQFLKDPYYWPDLWAKNQVITNPHLIFPGQQLRVRNGKLEVVTPPPKEVEPEAVPKAAKPLPLKETTEPIVVPVRTFTTSGAEGFLLEDDLRPIGFIVSTNQNRQLAGEDDIVYTDIGRERGANVGDRYGIYKKMAAVSHPVTNEILGYKVIPLGTLQISELEEKVAKAIIVKSYMEISAGSYLMPYRERKISVPLKASTKELTGYIVETQTGNNAISAGDVAYLDLGKNQGAEPGNMLYVVRDVKPDMKYTLDKIEKLPVEVIGALVIVESGPNTSTVLVVKSIDTIYRGDRVEMKKE